MLQLSKSKCRVSRCPHPKDNGRIRKNWIHGENLKLNGKIGSYRVNVIEKLDITTVDIAEIFLTEQLIEENLSNHSAEP